MLMRCIVEFTRLHDRTFGELHDSSRRVTWIICAVEITRVHARILGKPNITRLTYLDYR